MKKKIGWPNIYVPQYLFKICDAIAKVVAKVSQNMQKIRTAVYCWQKLEKKSLKS